MWAACGGHLNALKALLPVSDVHQQDQDGRTALVHAARHGHVRCLNVLLPLSAVEMIEGALLHAKNAACRTLMQQHLEQHSTRMLVEQCLEHLSTDTTESS
jgi:ankyrin repeat protein